MLLEVVLDIFSGRPNPSWVLPHPLEAELVARLEALRPAPAEDVPEPPGLGYRGFIVQAPLDSKFLAPVRVYRGMVQRASEKYVDPERQLERWLLDTAGLSLEGNLEGMVRRELERS